MDKLLPGTYNFREAAADVKVIKHGVLYRSDALDQITDDAEQRLVDMGITTIIDLRSEQELRMQPSNIHDARFNIVHVPVLGGSVSSLVTDDITLEKLYKTLITENGGEIAKAIQAVSDAPDSVVIHCTAGKDRTGIVVALILAVVGVDEREIINDYALTESNLAGEWAEKMNGRIEAYGLVPNDALKVLIYSSPPSALRSVFEYLNQEYGSVSRYLLSIGISDETQGRLTHKLAR